MGDLILAVETSCDDTCVALLEPGGTIRANVISSQGIHSRYGGVVPEIASRQHLELLNPVFDDALDRAGATLDDVGLVAATRGPGLVAALLVGFSAAKAIAAARELDFAPVDHLHGHVAANFVTVPGRAALEPPFVTLIASGGHTLMAVVHDREGGWGSVKLLGQTLDDAAGEAFDKGARMLGLGYPGGPALERLAAGGDPAAFDFPTGKRRPGLDFSFAGLKTSLLYKIRDLGEAEAERRRADLAAAYQHAIVESLVLRVQRGLRETGLQRLAVGGGVAANGPLRARLEQLGVAIDIPDRALCTDNAAMIASAARYVPALSFPRYLPLDVYATGEVPVAA